MILSVLLDFDVHHLLKQLYEGVGSHIQITSCYARTDEQAALLLDCRTAFGLFFLVNSAAKLEPRLPRWTSPRSHETGAGDCPKSGHYRGHEERYPETANT